MKIAELRSKWESLGRRDPLWAILSDPNKKGGRWNLDEFLRSGEDEIAEVMREIDSSGFKVRNGYALDFGCGVGRLTQALCTRFDRVVGVDISSAMIDQARALNSFGDRCEYVLNDRADLRRFASSEFDFVLSHIVLQHIPPRYSLPYIAEMVRILRPGGLAVFQLPSRRVKGRLRATLLDTVPIIGNALRRLRHSGPVIDMFAVPVEKVIATVNDAGGRILRIASDHTSGKAFESNEYYVSKAT